MFDIFYVLTCHFAYHSILSSYNMVWSPFKFQELTVLKILRDFSGTNLVTRFVRNNSYIILYSWHFPHSSREPIPSSFNFPRITIFFFFHCSRSIVLVVHFTYLRLQIVSLEKQYNLILLNILSISWSECLNRQTIIEN